MKLNRKTTLILRVTIACTATVVISLSTFIAITDSFREVISEYRDVIWTEKLASLTVKQLPGIDINFSQEFTPTGMMEIYNFSGIDKRSILVIEYEPLSVTSNPVIDYEYGFVPDSAILKSEAVYLTNFLDRKVYTLPKDSIYKSFYQERLLLDYDELYVDAYSESKNYQHLAIIGLSQNQAIIKDILASVQLKLSGADAE